MVVSMGGAIKNIVLFKYQIETPRGCLPFEGLVLIMIIQ
jgi:hypothetical protein